MSTTLDNIVPEGFEDIQRSLRKVWGKDSSTSKNWNEHSHPELGQSAVSALIIQEGYGGDIMAAVVNGRVHYWNVVDGEVVDLTRSKFARSTVIGEGVVTPRTDFMRYASIIEKYVTLKNRIRI